MHISFTEKLDDRHRCHWIIHDGMWYLAEFQREKQLQDFAKMMGFTYELREERQTKEYGIYREYNMSLPIVDMKYHFYSPSDLPEDVEPFLALSNGSIVTCYHRKTAKQIEIYRPNPNADKSVYDPLPTIEHIGYVALHGLY